MRWPLIIIASLAACQPAPAPKGVVALVPPPPFCTRTLGMAECFADPVLLPDHPAGWGDTPVRPIQPPIPWWQKVTDHWN